MIFVTILLVSFELKKNAHLPTSEFGDQNIKPIFFLIKNKTQINININNIHINDNRHLLWAINSYTFNVQIYHISSFKKIKMSDLQINHTII